jgi:tripartite-type tricarboxylate transporter receptor subunit TctC
VNSGFISSVRRRHIVGAGLSFLFPLSFSGLVFSREFWSTDKPIRLIIPAQPGGGLDLIARILSEKLSKNMGVSWVADNIGGGGGTIASITTARSAPDGQTLMLVNISTHGTNPAARSLPYDALRDFSHIAMIGGSPNVLVAGPSLGPVSNFESLIVELKRIGKPVTYGSAGPGTSSHLLMEELGVATGIQFIHVPYRGIGPALIDVIAGRTDLAFPGLIAALQLIKSNKLKPIAVTAPKRIGQFPQLQTFTEIGLPEFSSLQWYGISGPAGIAPTVVDALNFQINKALEDPQLVTRLEADCFTVTPMTSKQFGLFVAKDIAKWSKLVKDRNIRIEV